MNNNEPLVSVVIPTYNRSEKLKRAIRSVLNQTYDNFELIIVDDASEYDTEKLVTSFNDGRINHIQHNENRGGAAARNTGIKESGGKYISFLDDDDAFLPKKIEKLVSVLEPLSDEWIGAYSWSIIDGRVRASYMEGDVKYELLSENPKLRIGGSSSLFLRSQDVKAIGGFDESFERHQELEFLLRIMSRGKLKLVKEPLFVKESRKAHYPSAEDYLKIKKKFLSKFSKLLEKYNCKQRKKVFSSFWLEAASRFLEERKIGKSAKYFKKSIKYYPPFLSIEKYYNFFGRIKSALL